MRMLMKAKMSTVAANAAIEDGSLPKTLQSSVEALNAEAVYFAAEDGVRTALIFFDMADSSEIPPAAEPFFLNLGAEISFQPVMNVEEMSAGVAKAMEAA
jgi:hypothetical protein